ncbi:Transforming growth factor-beta receptor-associated protein 1 [Fulvia fulva]|uniref:Transforming growth factor-beta receptor-associated protein 1 n=1 Tax=Passalora fulva TaxID=5499 RepID=A0A9Q8P5P5_PASFU|nr:Transforming growth factor-beta receptor-associated protein 1 [Fulvia fulva]KAK4633367.1 Transforming growth factor-beta receptor-associated protein 1 [Fulvia fulva]UJO14144.1 Transforming growth factor-beta receptor-associated protein 1 [Fulvia fulva]WPV11248.1 Transforming growth factor-beta receptor-associated protein 1 [Fulvia fulva]
MGSTDGSDAATSYNQHGTPGSYTLRELIRDVPLSTDEDGVQAHITCVDAWNGNLYIGTSAGEILHYVSIPPDPSDESGQPSYIFATKIEPTFNTAQEGAEAGVKQILLLPNVSKACIVCNQTLTFFTLPELSPAYGGIKQASCSWVGGLDKDVVGQENGNGTVVVICLRQRLRLIRMKEDGTRPEKVRDIELAGITVLERRGDLACVADGQIYSLLDVVNHRKNELFPISSLSVPQSPRQEELVPPLQNRPAARSFSSRSPVRHGRGHQRNISLGGKPQSNDRLRPDSSSPWPARGSSRQDESPVAPSSRQESPTKPAPEPASRTSTDSQPVEDAKPSRPIPPHVLSATPNEFLLTTGTKLEDPGVGMFVNLDGDVVRGTMEFSSYPESLVLDGTGQSPVIPSSDSESQAGYVLAVVRRQHEGTAQVCIEVQRWDVDPGEAHRSKEWLTVESTQENAEDDSYTRGVGLRNASTSVELTTNGVSSGLRLRRLIISDATDETTDTPRNEEEDKLAARFAHVQANVLLYAKDKVSWIARTPLIVQLDRQLDAALQQSEEFQLSIDVPTVQSVVNSVRGQEPRDELEFLTLTYVRQKAAILLFGNLVLQTIGGVISYEHDKRRTEDALVAGEIDPRIVLTLLPPLDQEIIEGKHGMWMPQGLRDTVDKLRKGFSAKELKRDVKGPYGDNLLKLIKQYLMEWRKKKGFGSVADEASVFQTVDAALLHVLFLLDENSPRGPATPGTIREELNQVVDKGVDCFDRAIELCEQFQRLYVLGRLYQSRKLVSQVLATWKRIVEGEKDAGGEMIKGEHDIRRYLAVIRDATLVQDYGAWLAHRNPKLGVQIFADDKSRVRFQPKQAVAILKARAPGAVKDYLEHLVFGKKDVEYINDLIVFYLDTVLHELEGSKDSRSTLIQSYETYRALHPPKPTYREFITDNAIEAEWWQNRLRLLQLIGGSHGAASQYDVHTLGERLAPYSNELVPEMIILNGREGKHEAALRLLTHGLGDYDTAIRYCLLGGSSIFHPSSGLVPDQPLPSKEEQSHLFQYLLNEFFKIEHLSERLERTAELLERFGGWFDVAQVLDLIPEDWSVELVSGFLVHAFRRLVGERNESDVVKALCSAQNLRRSGEWVEKMEAVGASVVVDSGGGDVG